MIAIVQDQEKIIRDLLLNIMREKKHPKKNDKVLKLSKILIEIGVI